VRRLALLVAGLFLVSMCVMAADIPADKATIKWETKMGTVTFPHKAHADREKCATCHHTTKEGEAVKACGTCHGKEATDKAPKLQDAAHKLCKGCHEKTVAAGKKAPGKDCKSCHVKTAA
jgi:predicted CXXCH cytochrome family protein